MDLVSFQPYGVYFCGDQLKLLILAVQLRPVVCYLGIKQAAVDDIFIFKTDLVAGSGLKGLYRSYGINQASVIVQWESCMLEQNISPDQLQKYLQFVLKVAEHVSLGH